MTVFFRIQEPGISLEDMKKHNSGDGGDGYGHIGGLCVSDTPDEFGGAWSIYNDNDGEVVIMRGEVLAEIYDGYRIRPTEIIARFSKGEWSQMMDDHEIWDYEFM